MPNKALLKWYLDMGVDEATQDVPRNFFAVQPIPVEKPTIVLSPMPLHHSPADAAGKALELARSAQNLTELEAMVRAFTGCALKKTAGKTVFAGGNPNASIMLIGDAPDTADDEQGTPFSGINGQLLDKMLKSIGLDRNTTYLTNLIFWRPPGNRQPSTEEIAICLPFVEKHIALAAPQYLLLCGGIAAAALLKRDQSISRLRGKWVDYTNEFIGSPLPALTTFHPAYLIKQPAQKRLAWQDLLLFQSALSA